MVTRYRVNSIFKTLQGEGEFIGMPCTFVRFSLCNKWSGKTEHKAKSICSFCDTDFLDYKSLTASDIVAVCREFGLNNIILSGGEPCLQIDKELVETLKDFNLHLETNGSISIGALADYFAHITMSPKQSYKDTKLERCDDMKFLYPYINADITPSKFLGFEYNRIYLQPVEEPHRWKENQLKTIQACLETGYYLSPQLHKLLNLK